MITFDTFYTIQRVSGLSQDDKPLGMKPGSIFMELDTGKKFIFDGETWHEQPQGGGITLPGKTVVITGAMDVYVGDVGDYGYAILLDADNDQYGYSNCTFALAWNPATTNLNFLAFNPTKTGGYESRVSADYYGSYDAETKTITFKDYSATNGTWQFIPYTN